MLNTIPTTAAEVCAAAVVVFAPLVAPVRLPAPVAADLPVNVICSVPIIIVPTTGKLSSAATGMSVTASFILPLSVVDTPAVLLLACKPQEFLECHLY